MRVLPGLTIALALTLSGCSADLPTSAMKASIVVVVGEAGSQVTAVLSTGELTSVELPGDDTLSATSGAASSRLAHDPDLGSYTGGLDRVVDPGTEVTVSLRRGQGSAPASTVTLPEPIFVAEPKPGALVSRGRDLVIGTTSGVGSVRVEWAGGCVADGSLDLDEGAPVVVPAGDVVGAAPDARCDVTYTVSRVATGDLDPAFAGGSITAQRSVSVAVTSVP